MGHLKLGFLGGALLAGAVCAQTPETGGDRVNTVNPRYDLSTIRPAGFEPRVGAMALRPDGKLVVVTVNQGWAAGTGADIRTMYLLDGVDLGDPAKITVKKIAGPELMNDPLGLVILDGAYYLTDKDDLIKLVDNNGDGVLDARSTVGRWKYGGTGHEFAFGPVYKDGYFYVTLSVALAGPGPSAMTQKVDERGTVLKMDAKTGAYTVMADGLRTPNGLGFGPRGELFVADNQGSYYASSTIMNIRQGRHYGHPLDAPVPKFQANGTTPPSVWTPHGEIGRSPGDMVLLESGPYAGQLAVPDLSQGGVKRVFLEEVNGEWQGAIMPLSGGLEAGMHRILVGKDGSLYLGGIGNGDLHNWGWLGRKFGLQKLKPNGKPLFEILAVRSRKNGMEVEFTEPVDPAFDPAKIEVYQWWYTREYQYGCCTKEKTKRVIKSRQLSPDGKSLFLEVEGLKAGWVTHIKAYGIKSKTGQAPWINEAWYTLNAISPTSAFEKAPLALGDGQGAAAGAGTAKWGAGFKVRGMARGLVAALPEGAERLEIHDLRGAVVGVREVKGLSEVRWDAAVPGPGVYMAVVRSGSRKLTVPFTAP